VRTGCCTARTAGAVESPTPRRPPEAVSSAGKSCASADDDDCGPFCDHAVQALARGSTEAASNRVRRETEAFIRVLSFGKLMDRWMHEGIVGARASMFQHPAGVVRPGCIRCNGRVLFKPIS